MRQEWLLCRGLVQWPSEGYYRAANGKASVSTNDSQRGRSRIVCRSEISADLITRRAIEIRFSSFNCRHHARCQSSMLSSNTAFSLPVSLSHERYERTVLPASAYCSKFMVSP